MNHRIAFIGAGNMAGALIGGLLADGVPADRIVASDPAPAKREALRAATGIQTLDDNLSAVVQADVVVLAVKPQVLREVAQGLADGLAGRRPVVVSIAAGIRCASLQSWLGGNVALVRTMPNTPAMIQSGATVLYATPGVSTAQREQAESLMRAVGLTQWIDDEALMDAVTALSGSGPAYLFLVMEAIEAAARDLGLDHETARLLTLQTAFGAARMALESTDPPATLRARVTSPGGTTERAIAVLEDGGIRDLFGRALKAARDRSVELSADLGAA
ncbi:MAG: pyrroline-5-carboxylate reductase [Chromatiaceae bacterium]|nr:pyrroline-5-carboxylate reductase [Gammaproteobacteria bacterium]MCP5313236.1 pyrroline-5-carboxylate reductase [Chromatiaceae bacterium]